MNHSHKFTLIFLLCFIFSHLAFGQDKPVEGATIAEDPGYNDNFKHSFFTGGNLGVQFGTVTMVDISPQFGYYIFENMSVGMGLTYQYINDRRFSATMHVLGGRVFTRLYLPFYNSIFAHGEYEYMTYNTNVFSLTGQKEWVQLSNILAGIGYRQRIYGRSAVTMMVLWNFNDTPYTLYSNPVIRAGVDIGF
ncbi:MAG: hypothetical protein WCL06_12310 [Bacteroidota bacterium]